MKKLFTGILATFLLITAAAAKNDIQLSVEPLSLSSIYIYDTNIALENHNYFGEKKIFGIGEKLTYTVYSERFNVGTILVGPAYMHEFKHFAIQLISGFKYSYGQFTYTDNWPDTTLEVSDHDCFHGFEWGNDVQMKFFDEEMFSLIIGLSFSYGGNLTYETQSVKDTSGRSKYKTIYGASDFDIDSISLAPYVGFTYNF